MSNAFETTDPRGRRVVCTSNCWRKHILIKHPFLIRWRKKLQKAIEKPDAICKDADFTNQEIYYFLTGKRYIKIVVQFDSTEGQVITAFLTDSIKAGEILIWSK